MSLIHTREALTAGSSLLMAWIGAKFSGSRAHDVTTYHEVGHALAAIYYPSQRNALAGICNEPNSQGAGRSVMGTLEGSRPTTSKELFNEVVCGVSGNMAEIQKYGPKHKPDRGEDDYKIIDEIIEELLGHDSKKEQREEIIASAEEASKKLMLDKSDELEIVAQVLKKQKRLSRVQIYQLLKVEDPYPPNEYTFPGF